MKAAALLLFVLAAVPVAAQSLAPKPSPSELLTQNELEPPAADTPSVAASSAETPADSGEAIRPITRPSKRRSFRRLRGWGADSRGRLRQVAERHRAANAQRR